MVRVTGRVTVTGRVMGRVRITVGLWFGLR